LGIRRGRKGREGNDMKGHGRMGRGDRVGKGEGGLDLDICPGARRTVTAA